MLAMRLLLLWTLLCSVALAKKDPLKNDPMSGEDVYPLPARPELMQNTNQLNFLDVEDENNLRKDSPREALEAINERLKRGACVNSARESTPHGLQRSLGTTRASAASGGKGKSGKGGVIGFVGSGGSSGSESKGNGSRAGNVANRGASGSGVNSGIPRGPGGKGNGVRGGSGSRKRCIERNGGSARCFGAPRIVKNGNRRVGKAGTGRPVACTSCPAILDISGDNGDSSEIIRVRSIISSDAPGESGVFSRDSGGSEARGGLGFKGRSGESGVFSGGSKSYGNGGRDRHPK